MKGILNKARIEYVLYHLGHHIEFNDRILTSICLVGPGEPEPEGKIIFKLSPDLFRMEKILTVNNIPVLFPIKEAGEFFTVTGRSIIFSHDLLKSAFYLLSGYQEWKSEEKDFLGRFPFSASVQSQAGFAVRPLVNYYFEELGKGIHEFCRINNIEFKTKKPCENFMFFLSHDIDRIRYYTFNNFLYTVMQVAGLKKPDRNRLQLLKKVFAGGIGMLSVPASRDPFRNFAWMSESEKKLGITSTWYFLPRDRKNVDSRYRLDDPEIKGLMKYLIGEGHEAGIHGTVRSHLSADAMRSILDKFTSASGMQNTGIRQHRLMWKHPDTALIQEQAGIRYDSSLGFAAHEGFRNSYCHPFRIFDFDNDRMLEHWEIPLNVMDSTLFEYRRLDFEGAYSAVKKILDEVRRFNGVFSLLWHNSYLYDFEKKGISAFYTGLLSMIMSQQPEPLTGMEVISRMKRSDKWIKI